MHCNPDRPSTWIRFTPRMCEGCAATCCTLPLEVRLSDLVRLELVGAEEAESETPKKIAKRLIAEGWIKNYRSATELFMLESRPNGDCAFLNEQRLCKVYEKRPEVCRKFPAIGPRPGFCPRRPKS